MDWDNQGWTRENDGTPSGSLELGRRGRREMDGSGPLMKSFLLQAHAQAWHSYNSTWRSRQQGEPHHHTC